MRIAVLASHEGSTMQAVIDACGANQLDAYVELVISNTSSSGALRREAAAREPHLPIRPKTHGDDSGADNAMLQAWR